jgi:hypothetical protein
MKWAARTPVFRHWRLGGRSRKSCGEWTNREGFPKESFWWCGEHPARRPRITFGRRSIPRADRAPCRGSCAQPRASRACRMVKTGALRRSPSWTAAPSALAALPAVRVRWSLAADNTVPNRRAGRSRNRGTPWERHLPRIFPGTPLNTGLNVEPSLISHSTTPNGPTLAERQAMK